MGFKDAQGFKLPAPDTSVKAEAEKAAVPKTVAAGDDPHYHGHRERLRARFLDGGSDALPDYEMLELILFRAISRADTKPLAKALLAKFGSFGDVLAAPPARLKEIKGVGDKVVFELKLIHSAAVRLARKSVLDRPALTSWQALIDYCTAAMAYDDREQFRILFLDRKNVLIADEVQQRGTVDHTPVYPARGDQAGAGTFGQRHHPGAQPPLGRPHAKPGRHHHDRRDRRRGEEAEHYRARPRHHRPQGPCQLQVARADLNPLVRLELCRTHTGLGHGCARGLRFAHGILTRLCARTLRICRRRHRYRHRR